MNSFYATILKPLYDINGNMSKDGINAAVRFTLRG